MLHDGMVFETQFVQSILHTKWYCNMVLSLVYFVQPHMLLSTPQCVVGLVLPQRRPRHLKRGLAKFVASIANAQCFRTSRADITTSICKSMWSSHDKQRLTLNDGQGPFFDLRFADGMLTFWVSQTSVIMGSLADGLEHVGSLVTARGADMKVVDSHKKISSVGWGIIFICQVQCGPLSYKRNSTIQQGFWYVDAVVTPAAWLVAGDRDNQHVFSRKHCEGFFRKIL